MPRFIMTYIGGDRPSSEEEGQKQFARYQQWLGSLGDAAVSPMNPIRGTRTLSAGGAESEGSSVGMSGYTIVEADDLEAALAMARNCPFLEINGTLEVSELVQMS